MRDIGIAGEVSDGRMLGGEISAIRKMSFHETQETGGDLVGLTDIGWVAP